MPGIYLHIPFCVRKCNYCDFYSEALYPGLKSEANLNMIDSPGFFKDFPDFLCKEINLFVSNNDIDKSIDSIFFGGGTPSLLNPSQVEQIVEKLYKKFDIASDVEISLECNPGTLTYRKLKDYKNSGINRLSIGSQSFLESELRFLQRIHSPEEITKAYEYAREAGFDNVSIDLIFALPKQTKENLDFSLAKTLELRPEHVSAYSLIYEPGTPLFRDLKNNKITPLGDDTVADLYLFVIERLSAAGYKQYEVSNFAVEDKFKCRHNLNYWHAGEYFAFGPSAHGYFNNVRYWNYRSINKYYESLNDNVPPVEAKEKLSGHDRLNEYIMLGLRAEGIDVRVLAEKFDFNLFSRAGDFISELIENGFMVENGSKLSMTAKGYSVCDEIILKIIEKI
jgi:oxygen-independent coproporphyrinogen-3 oxidase